jgi:hypothetical protein
MIEPTAAQIEAAFLERGRPTSVSHEIVREVIAAEALAVFLIQIEKARMDTKSLAIPIACALGIEIGMRIARNEERSDSPTGGPETEMPKLGATGKFPKGHADAEDEGQIVFAIAADRAHGIVRLDFGTPVAWLGLPPLEAKELGLKLMQKAQEVETGWRPATPV